MGMKRYIEIPDPYECRFRRYDFGVGGGCDYVCFHEENHRNYCTNKFNFPTNCPLTTQTQVLESLPNATLKREMDRRGYTIMGSPRPDLWDTVEKYYECDDSDKSNSD